MNIYDLIMHTAYLVTRSGDHLKIAMTCQNNIPDALNENITTFFYFFFCFLGNYEEKQSFQEKSIMRRYFYNYRYF